jgi:hypothetical protein
MRLIAFAGLKGSGKDTAAQVFVESGFAHVKMAGPLKAMLRTLLEYQGTDARTIEAAIDGHLKEARIGYLCNRTPRHAMQTLGTEWGREHMASDFWIEIARNRIESLDRNVVISDIRFPNEVELVRELGGKVYRIDRHQAANDDVHPSEALILDLEVDGVVRNISDTAAHFAEYIECLFGLQHSRLPSSIRSDP